MFSPSTTSASTFHHLARILLCLVMALPLSVLSTGATGQGAAVVTRPRGPLGQRPASPAARPGRAGQGRIGAVRPAIRPAATGVITGTVYEDYNANGARDAREPGL